MAISDFSIALLKHMTKAPCRRNGSFEYMVPEGSESIIEPTAYRTAGIETVG